MADLHVSYLQPPSAFVHSSPWLSKREARLGLQGKGALRLRRANVAIQNSR